MSSLFPVSMDLRSCLISLCIVVQLPLFLAAPSGDGRSPLKTGDSESIRGIIIELENVLYKLKDYSRSLDETAGIKGGASQDVGRSRSKEAEVELSVPVSSQREDVSLKDAIEYLVALAKQKKAEKRDHDIPFPLVEN